MKKVEIKTEADNSKRFWIIAGLLCLVMIGIMAQNINRPFVGLHSWGEAHRAWFGRVHAEYGLGYTKGFVTWAVGNPPTENPTRYLDHPQLQFLVYGAWMKIFGYHDWTLRSLNILLTVVALLLFVKLVRDLTDEKTALIAGALFAVFPLNTYFGTHMLFYPTVFLALWCYAVLIGTTSREITPTKKHWWGLAIAQFLMIQLSWEGFFFALGIGVHFVARCLYRRQWPNVRLLILLMVAPLSSLAIVILTLCAGRGWDFEWIMAIYKWRAGSGEVGEHDWGKWFGVMWEYAVTNFSLPAVLLAIGYLVIGQFYDFAQPKDAQLSGRRCFPHFWLFMLPVIFQLFMLKGCLWKHQTWERPFIPLIAIAAAMAIVRIMDFANKIKPILAKVVMVVLIGIVAIFCGKGLQDYNEIIHFSPARVKLFKMLNERIPSDKALLSTNLPVEGLIVNQHEAKGEHYRPEIGWYLDREIVQARSLEEVLQKAKTGRFPFYLVPQRIFYLPPNHPVNKQLASFIAQLRKYYKYELIPADPGGDKKAPMLPYVLFDLRKPKIVTP